MDHNYAEERKKEKRKREEHVAKTANKLRRGKGERKVRGGGVD